MAHEAVSRRKKKTTTQGLAGRELEGDAGKIYLDDGGDRAAGGTSPLWIMYCMRGKVIDVGSRG